MNRIIELFQNVKVVSGILVVLFSALSASTYEVIDSHDEIDELKEKITIEVHTVAPEPVKHEEYNHEKMIQRIKTLQNEVKTLKRWH